MLFLGLLIYLLLLWPVYWLLDLYDLASDPVSLAGWLTGLFSVSQMLAVLTAYLVDIYYPGARSRLRATLRLTGLGWLFLLTAGAAMLSLAANIYWFGYVPGARIWAFLLPVAAVSALNLLGIEVPLRRLERGEGAKTLLLPPLPSPPPLPDTVEPKPLPPTAPSTPPPPPDTPAGDEYLRKFSWEFEGRHYEIELPIRKALYDDWRAQERVLDHGKWAAEYVAGGIDQAVRDLAHRLYSLGLPYGTYREVHFVLTFVHHSARYELEKGEYPRYPTETLVDGVGDCEDFSILGAALLKLMGYEVALLLLPGHAALGVAGAEGVPGTFIEHVGQRYYYCEMTGGGWTIGQLPVGCDSEQIEVSIVPTLRPRVVQAEV